VLAAAAVQDGRVNLFYSNPAIYAAAKASYPPASIVWPLKTDDFFPYADNPHGQWAAHTLHEETLIENNDGLRRAGCMLPSDVG
jgi:hypothetical protein